MKISRREFLKKGARFGLAIGLSPVVPRWARAALGEERAVEIAVVRGSTPEAVRRAVEMMGGIERFVKEGDRVLLKPNLSFATPPAWGATTSPDAMRTMVELLLGAGAARVLVLDHPLREPEACLRRTGVREACDGLEGVTILMPTDRRFYSEVEVPEGKALRRVEVAKEVARADVLVNLPVAKSHSATGVSLGMKNLMGLVWDRGHFHRGDLNLAIAELSTVIRPDLIVVDASRALVSGGPGGPGEVRELGIIVAGTDPVAVDAYVAELAPWHNRCWTGQDVTHIAAAHQLGVGEIKRDKFLLREVDLG